MARIRSVKPEFWDSPSTGKASLRVRLLYIAMWNWADDWGIGDANPRRLLSFAFPSDGDSEVEPRNFRHLAEELSRCYGVKFYEVEGREFYEIQNWEDHQRTEKRATRRNPPASQAETTLYDGTSDNPSLNRGTPPDGTGEQGNRGSGKGEQGNRGTVARATVTDPAPTRFDEFWDTYGKKVGKPKALAAYQTALKKRGVTEALLIAAAAEYVEWVKAEGNYPKYAKDPERWLRGEHWTDERPARVGPQTRTDEHLALVRKLAADEQDAQVLPLREIEGGRS